MFQWLWRLSSRSRRTDSVAESNQPTSASMDLGSALPIPGNPRPSSQVPAWASAIPVSTLPVVLCSPITGSTLFGKVAPGLPGSSERPATTTSVDEGMLHPVAGERNAVPWPFPVPTGAHALTFWGQGSTRTAKFILPKDAALRIMANGGPFELRIQRDDGTFLPDAAQLSNGMLGLMAISQGGTYLLIVEARAEWGITALY